VEGWRTGGEGGIGEPRGAVPEPRMCVESLTSCDEKFVNRGFVGDTIAASIHLDCVGENRPNGPRRAGSRTR
jgi:hypothetical protein